MGSLSDQVIRIAPGTSYTSGGLTGGILVSNGQARLLTITFSISVSRTMNFYVNSTAMPLNNGTAIPANNLYSFSIVVNPTDTFDFTFSGATTIQYFTGVLTME